MEPCFLHSVSYHGDLYFRCCSETTIDTCILWKKRFNVKLIKSTWMLSIYCELLVLLFLQALCYPDLCGLDKNCCSFWRKGPSISTSLECAMNNYCVILYK